jgi:K+-transporting ATPase ATPase C chain
MKKIVQSLKAYVIFSVLLGLIYPLGITFIAQFAMPYKANGSLLKKDGKVIGSSLIGQGFAKPEYFQSRPSAVNYDAANSGATNLGPSSKKLMDATAQNILKIRKDNALREDDAVPADMVLSSASGLDPHISLENALIQAERISKIRNIPVIILKGMISKNTDSDFIGIWGRPGVNVLTLNIALDDLKSKGR